MPRNGRACGRDLLLGHAVARLRRVDQSRRHRVDCHVIGRELERQRLGQGHHAGLAGVVVPTAQCGMSAASEAMFTIRPDRRDHQARRLLSAEERAFQIDVVHPIPRRLVELQRCGARVDAGVVDQDVEHAERLDELPEHGAKSAPRPRHRLSARSLARRACRAAAGSGHRRVVDRDPRPVLAINVAMAQPMPWLPPVTSAVLPENRARNPPSVDRVVTSCTLPDNRARRCAASLLHVVMADQAMIGGPAVSRGCVRRV